MAATTVETTLTGLFDQAVQTFGDAMKAGVRFQEDMTRWWSDVMEKSGPLADWQRRTIGTVRDAIPVAQQNAEEWFKLVEANSKKAMSLFKRAVESKDSESPADYQSRMQDIWESSLALFRDSAQSAAQANVKMLELLADLLKKNLNGAAKASAAVTA